MYQLHRRLYPLALFWEGITTLLYRGRSVYCRFVAMTSDHTYNWRTRAVIVAVMSRKRTPSEFLKQIIGRPVVVKLNSGVDYRGIIGVIRIVWSRPYLTQQAIHLPPPPHSHAPLFRYPCMSGWLHEHRFGADGGIR